MIVGITSDNFAQRKAAHRDLMLYNYIVTHPEDFPPIGKKHMSL